MNKMLLIGSLMLAVSCSTLVKKDTEDYFTVKSFDLASGYSDNVKIYYSTSEEEHCFKSNPKNKEIITVDSAYIDFAVDHFYKRVIKVDIKNVSTNYTRRIEVTTREDANFSLEVANCLLIYQGGLQINGTRSYTSFRLKD